MPSISSGSVRPGTRAQDRADVDRTRPDAAGTTPSVAPARERADDGQQVTRPLGELVVHARRHLAVALAGQQAVGNHAVEPRAQLLGRDPGQHPLQLDEAAGTSDQVADDQQRPLVANQIERARVWRPLVVRMPLWGWNGGNGCLP